MSDLVEKHCAACEGGVPTMTREEINKTLAEIPNWTLNQDATKITRRYEFKNFYKTMAFVNAVAWIANQENHHPDLEVGYNYCVIHYQTHALNGLSINDFICAAKVNALSD